jgi:hypothetical protein
MEGCKLINVFEFLFRNASKSRGIKGCGMVRHGPFSVAHLLPSVGKSSEEVKCYFVQVLPDDTRNTVHWYNCTLEGDADDLRKTPVRGFKAFTGVAIPIF